MSAYLGQLRTELRLSARQGEQLLVSLGIPLLVLVFFSAVDVLPTGTAEPVDYLAPAVLGLAVMSTAMVSLGIGTGFERQYGVLKRLGAAPLGRGRWVAAKLTGVLLTEVVQWVLLIAVAVALGWAPPASGWLPAIGAALLGTAAFGGLGLLMAGTLPGLATLAGANGLYLVLLLTGGMVVPLDELPFRGRGGGTAPASGAAHGDPHGFADRRAQRCGLGLADSRGLGHRSSGRRIGSVPLGELSTARSRRRWWHNCQLPGTVVVVIAGGRSSNHGFPLSVQMFIALRATVYTARATNSPKTNTRAAARCRSGDA